MTDAQHAFIQTKAKRFGATRIRIKSRPHGLMVTLLDEQNEAVYLVNEDGEGHGLRFRFPNATCGTRRQETHPLPGKESS